MTDMALRIPATGSDGILFLSNESGQIHKKGKKVRQGVWGELVNAIGMGDLP